MPGVNGALKKGPNSHEGTISWQGAQESLSSLSDLKGVKYLSGTEGSIAQSAPFVAGVSCLFSRQAFKEE